MNGKSKESLRKKKRGACRVSLPLNEAVEEALGAIPSPLQGRGKKAGRDNYALLALYEGLLTLAEHFEEIQKNRPLRRSDMVFRFEVVPGVVGRAVQAEQEARAIESLLDAATDAAGL